jgi:hypothetical protein
MSKMAPDHLKKKAPSEHNQIFVAGVISTLICCGLLAPESVLSMQTANTEATLGITFRAEHDDNITLASDTAGDAKEDELIFHVIPSLDMTRFFGDHNLNANLNGDFRKGADIVDDEINLEAGIGVDFNFAGGLMIGLSDTYLNEDFDQQLYTELGVSDHQANTYGAKAAYSFGERTSLEATYSHMWEEYDDKPVKSVYDTDTVTGRITVPVSRRWISYLDAKIESIESDEVPIRNDDAVEGVLGFRWQGPNRFSCWIEGGASEHDYEHEAEVDYSEAVGEAGVEVALTAWSFFQASIGQNSYGELKYDGIFRHNFQDKFEMTLGASQSTVRSYVVDSDEQLYDTTLFKLELNSTFWERIEAGFAASYQLQDKKDDSIETLIGEATLDYPIQDWVKAGARYQYATRTADNAQEEYDDNRIGLFVTFSI